MKDYAKLALLCGCYILCLYESYKVGEIFGNYIAEIIAKKINNA